MQTMHVTSNRLRPVALLMILALAMASPAAARLPAFDVDHPVSTGRNATGHRDGARAVATGDTIWFGGSGLGDGTIIRGGVWDWEADSGEPAQFFPDGDPVGNQYRDGWRFTDRTAVNGPSELGAGHFQPDGTYRFEDDSGSFAHRATTHLNDGIDDGPDPLDDPGNPDPSAWSVWIGTNLYLNPEHCAWAQTAGYGNGWSQGIMKRYEISAPPGAPIDISFFHRYAIEAGFDTCWVETSYDGTFWSQVGTASNANGVFNGGDRNGPLPAPGGAPEVVQLTGWPGGTGDLHVRFRVATDNSLSDEYGGGDLFFSWQLDDISLSVNGGAVDFTDFESGYGGWEPRSFEGFDFDLTLDPELAAGRVVLTSDLLCPIMVPCPEACGLDGNILIFCDKDECSLGDAFQSSFAASPAFSIGGPENPDIDGFEGRLVALALYLDGGAGLFETGAAWCVPYWPYNANACPLTPSGASPGAGETFNWSRPANACNGAAQGVGVSCYREYVSDMSAFVPAEADSVWLAVGVISYCRHEPNCDLQDNGAPFFDSVRFGVYDPEGSSIAGGYYSDSFPLAEQAHQGMPPNTTRSDGSQNYPASLGIEIPLRHVRADTVRIVAPGPNIAAFLRWRTVPSPCQNLASPFFAAYPPNAWHEARMDVGREQGVGTPDPSTYMTCFHPSEANDGTSWGGEMLPVEPCDDILPDGVFVAGTTVDYFFEVRDATTGEVIGTNPNARNAAPIDTTEGYASFWFEFQTLPELVAPSQGGSCDPLDPVARANNILVVNDGWRVDDVAKPRLEALLDSFGLGYDWYDVVGTASSGSYNGIGRREDRATQVPRPPVGGATAAQLDPYDCIWYCADLYETSTLDDMLTVPELGGQPAIAQQKLEGWLAGCVTDGEERLLILSGYGWASDIDARTEHGSMFLEALGVDVISDDYSDISGDLRRCARLTGIPGVQPAGRVFEGEAYGTGCPENLGADVLASISGGEVVANFVDSHEGGADPVDCSDDVNMPDWAGIIRNAAGPGACRRSVAMGVSFLRLHDLDCTDECLFDEWRMTGSASSAAQVLADLFEWANIPIGAPIGVSEDARETRGAPALPTRLVGSRPNPANSSATIRFSLGVTGLVTIRVYNVAGQVVRTLVDEQLQAIAAPYEVVWDGRDDSGRGLASGVFFYQLDAPGYTSAKKLILLK
jgi:hypothetical protein